MKTSFLPLVLLFVALLGTVAFAAKAFIFEQEEPVAVYSLQGEPIVYDPAPVLISVELAREEEWICPLSEEDISLIALLTMAEAEGESEYGKRLVIDTVLNRMDSEHFPNTAYGVIYQKKHFSSVWNGRMDRCSAKDDICKLVVEELKERTNNEVIFFNAGHYSKYGVPMFKEDHHYFSKYE